MNAIRTNNKRLSTTEPASAGESSVAWTIDRFANSARLPSLPEVALKLVQVAQQSEPDYSDISQIIRSDPVISGKILKTVNSALFGFRHKIETVEEALPKLGLTLLRTLILSFHLARHRTDEKTIVSALQNHWRSSLTQAVIAEMIAEELGDVDPPTYFLAGMMQDIGILAMLSEAPQVYLQQVLARANFPDVAAAERSHFGFCHVDVTARILELWGMESCFGDTLKHHHDRVVPVGESSDRKLAIALQAASQGADLIASHQNSPMSLSAAVADWASLLKLQMGFSEQKSQGIMDEVNQRVNEYSAMFSFNIGDSVSNERVVEKAKDMLQEIALENQLNSIAKAKSASKHANKDELYRDTLTGLRNRRFLNEEVPPILQSVIDKRKPIGFLFLDVDKFKSINDQLGHAAGDQAIRHVAAWLEKSIRKHDVAIRLGGDEFLIVLQKMKQSDFQSIANRIATDMPPLELDETNSLAIRFSVGGVFYQPEKGDQPNPNWLIDQADQLMYRAKRETDQALVWKSFTGKPQN